MRMEKTKPNLLYVTEPGHQLLTRDGLLVLVLVPLTNQPKK
jgi:hypothetical protein